MLTIPDYKISKFYGTNTNIKDIKTLKAGYSPDSLNWITGGAEGDHIELRRGYKLLGQTKEDGTGEISGLGVALRYDGVEIPFFSHDRKLKYYDEATDDIIEISSDILPVTADGESVWFEPYQNLAGSFMFCGSPNSGIYKIPTANPGDAVDQKVNNYRFNVFHIGRGRSFAGQRNGVIAGNKDDTGLYLSYIDKSLLSSYTQVTNETFGTGDGSTKIFTHTVVAITEETNKGRTIMYPSIYGPISASVNISAITKANQAKITASGHGLTEGDFIIIASAGGMTEINNIIATVTEVIDSSNVLISIDSTSFTTYTSGGTITKIERFVDDRVGGLVSNLGGTGTVNYATGVIDLEFHTAPVSASNNIKCSYYHETSTKEGILDFSGSSNGQGKVFRQDDCGKFMAIFNLNTIEYCFHELKTYQLTVSLDDTSSTNLPYRNIGINSKDSACQTPEGILFADLARPNEPKFRILEEREGTNSTTIVPTPISDDLDLTPFDFEKCVAFRWGNYRIFAIQEKKNGQANTFNSVMWIQDVTSKAWFKLDYYASKLAEYNGMLIAGDSVSNNVYVLFSGYDEDGDIIDNYWTSSELNLDTENSKSCRRMVIDGLIQKDQKLEIYIETDGGLFSLVQTIDGAGTYVDTGINTYIGANTIGSKVIGGGASEDTAHPFTADFKINQNRFNYIRVKIKAIGVGYASVNGILFKDIRDKGQRNLNVRTI